MAKVCSACKLEKPLDDFHVRTQAKDGKQNVCKSCNKDQRKAYYRTANGRSKNIATGKRSRYRLQVKLMDYLSEHPCVDCGETDIVVLEFDHLRDKVMGVADMVRHGHSWRAILSEIEKCEVRCANCHTRITYARSGSYRLGFGPAGA